MNEAPQLTVEEAKKRLDEGNATFVDVRDPLAFRNAHIPGAAHVGDHNVEEFVDGADKNRCLLVYCYHGFVSQGGAAYFLDQGFKEVYSIIGGFEAWRQTYESEAG
ncbi:MAG: thiosulfate sulfurtransferase GlpE [Deltaproteobacteria bacterium]|nr:thiosulfate sulfurtransferase GlpE [Deltaproteobacteria bacterium]